MASAKESYFQQRMLFYRANINDLFFCYDIHGRPHMTLMFRWKVNIFFDHYVNKAHKHFVLTYSKLRFLLVHTKRVKLE